MEKKRISGVAKYEDEEKGEDDDKVEKMMMRPHNRTKSCQKSTHGRRYICIDHI